MVKNLPSNARDTGSIPGWETKIPHAAQCGQKNKDISEIRIVGYFFHNYYWIIHLFTLVCNVFLNSLFLAILFMFFQMTFILYYAAGTNLFLTIRNLLFDRRVEL